LLDRVNEALDATPIAGDTTVAEIACGFLCGVAPAVQWDGRWIGRATAESVRELVATAESE
jgi:NADH:ubiquinone oxidoreductase subunit E